MCDNTGQIPIHFSSKKEAQPGEFKKSFQHSPIKSQWDFAPRREHRKRSSNFQKQNKQTKKIWRTLIPDAELFIIKVLMPARC